MSVWFSNFQEYNASRNGNLPLADLKNSDISLINTLASVTLMVAMGLATDVNVFLKVIKNIPLCLTGAITQFVIMPVLGIIFLQIFNFTQLGKFPIY